MQKRRIEIYDTTLRDGSQGEGVNFTVEDKLKIAQRLDEFGMDYIEGGWPASNPKDSEFFQRARGLKLSHAKLAAFGSTRRAKLKAEEDENLQALVACETPVVTIFGKSWDMHVTHALKVSLQQNLEMIHDSVRFLKERVPQVIYDAEHFFDGYKHNPEYAVKTLLAAQEAGADILVLCDTNGGTLPTEIAQIMEEVKARVHAPLGIHTHNDSECAVANSLIAVQHGAMHVQGTINGYGERTGNANLCSIIPALMLKMGYDCLKPDSLTHLTALSGYIDEIANMPHNHRMPYVGRSAFAHKGGVHVDAVLKHERTYEHIPPAAVGNERRILVSELAGGSTVAHHAQRLGLQLDKSTPEVRRVLQKVAHLENEGYSFEAAEASFELMLMQQTGHYRKLFDLKGFRVIVEKRGDKGEVVTEATVKVAVDGREMLTVAEGNGPVHALDSALRKALLEFYPELAQIRLTDYKVRVVNVREGTAAKVRVIVESEDGEQTWSTTGVSTNIIEASWHALVDSIEYGLLTMKTEAKATP